MSHKLLIKEALRRQQIFKNLDKYLAIIKTTVKQFDKNAEIYLFGSVAEGKHLYSSDIDILIVTNLKPAFIMDKLWEKNIKNPPFEIHVCTPTELPLYKSRANLVKI